MKFTKIISILLKNEINCAIESITEARVAIRLVFPGHVFFFRVKNSVWVDFLNLAKRPGFGQIIVYRYSL